jgi:hypothetical protein
MLLKADYFRNSEIRNSLFASGTPLFTKRYLETIGFQGCA